VKRQTVGCEKFAGWPKRQTVASMAFLKVWDATTIWCWDHFFAPTPVDLASIHELKTGALYLGRSSKKGRFTGNGLFRTCIDECIHICVHVRVRVCMMLVGAIVLSVCVLFVCVLSVRAVCVCVCVLSVCVYVCAFA
jgi:hypothetical protein